jgi:hypothetical protein
MSALPVSCRAEEIAINHQSDISNEERLAATA